METFICGYNSTRASRGYALVVVDMGVTTRWTMCITNIKNGKLYLLHFPIWLHPAESLRTLVAPDVRFYVGFLGHHFCRLCNRQAQNNSLFRLRVERDDSGRKLQRVARSGGLGLEGGNLHSTGGGLASISVCLNLRPVLSIGPRSSPSGPGPP